MRAGGSPHWVPAWAGCEHPWQQPTRYRRSSCRRRACKESTQVQLKLPDRQLPRTAGVTASNGGWQLVFSSACHCSPCQRLTTQAWLTAGCATSGETPPFSTYRPVLDCTGNSRHHRAAAGTVCAAVASCSSTRRRHGDTQATAGCLAVSAVHGGTCVRASSASCTAEQTGQLCGSEALPSTQRIRRYDRVRLMLDPMPM